MARSCIEEAGRRLKVAELMLEERAYAYCIRQSQEAVELLLKAALRIVGVEPPKWYDVGPVPVEFPDRFPEWFREKIPGLSATSRWLRRKREQSMYGDGAPPSKLYTEPYATRAVEEARTVYTYVKKLLDEIAQHNGS